MPEIARRHSMPGSHAEPPTIVVFEFSRKGVANYSTLAPSPRRNSTRRQGCRSTMPRRYIKVRREREPDLDPLEELVRIVGQPDGVAPRPRSEPTSAHRIRSNRR